ncbi:MAG: alpha/beta fold hydrolase [Mongoliibacter sp.]|uniref:alpha/beta hydrolase family protein n=1 Tax=Mongoliibacter sp. TaxID=2022438 RepID=UPI0012F18809|nr:alpha/beta fold hydrolase [Mongoliibacter sp.]TVP49744.1 MAG: alpha/beta fold hydrolase [Mongoliibacter sp.]
MYRYMIVLGLALLSFHSALAVSKDSMNISFQSEGYTLKGKLVVPQNTETKVPAIIFLIGSGGNSSYAKDYKKFIDFFLESPMEKEDIAFLYFDKRGVGESEGKWQNTDFEQRAEDAKNAAAYLQSLPQIDAEKIYVVGHSQGGWIVQICLAKYPEYFAGGISMAGPTFNVKKQLINDYQSAFICNKEMTPEKALKKARRRVYRDLTIVSILPLQEDWKQLKVIRKFDPKKYLLNIEKPLLLLFAENDRLVNPSWSMEHLEMLYPEGAPGFISHYIAAGENHSFKTSPLCYIGPWGELKFSAKTRDVIQRWFDDHI